MTDERARSGGGRRPGSTQTREAILLAATEAFTQKGFSATTIRGVARAAEVDPALVIHFFGTKDGLFEAAIRGHGMPLRQISEVVGGDPDRLGERLARRYLSLWEDPATGAWLHAILHAVSASETASAMLKEFMTEEVLRPIAKDLGMDNAETRAILAGSHLIGIGLTRYVLRVEAIASLPADTVVAAVGPTLQHYFTGDLQLG
ncbi:TetR family transcriptional regulator [Sphaerisporangium viridialbum]|uniref:TetR/AcrR family transcriptional regulator n=2 Tax=Sphaerisporangium TaxID=321315 RepID=UPI003C7095B1